MAVLLTREVVLQMYHILIGGKLDAVYRDHWRLDTVGTKGKELNSLHIWLFKTWQTHLLYLYWYQISIKINLKATNEGDPWKTQRWTGWQDSAAQVCLFHVMPCQEQLPPLSILLAVLSYYYILYWFVFIFCLTVIVFPLQHEKTRTKHALKITFVMQWLKSYRWIYNVVNLCQKLCERRVCQHHRCKYLLV